MTQNALACNLVLGSHASSEIFWHHEEKPDSPLGDSSVEAVSQQNRMASRVVLLILLCAARGINWVL